MNRFYSVRVFPPIVGLLLFGGFLVEHPGDWRGALSGCDGLGSVHPDVGVSRAGGLRAGASGAREPMRQTGRVAALREGPCRFFLVHGPGEAEQGDGFRAPTTGGAGGCPAQLVGEGGRHQHRCTLLSWARDGPRGCSLGRVPSPMARSWWWGHRSIVRDAWSQQPTVARGTEKGGPIGRDVRQLDAPLPVSVAELACSPGFDAPRFELSSAALERRSARMGSFPGVAW